MSSPVLTPLELPKSGSKVLVITAHPDDVELGCGGTLLSAVAQGKKVGIILTGGNVDLSKFKDWF